jgi:protein phosphatase
MGSTCVMRVVTSDGKVYYGHIGDSRLYIVANHQITQLTKDHSFVQTLVDEGRITKEQAEHHPRKNEITNALGILDMRPPTLCGELIEPEAGNCFVLCSDGLSGMIDDQHIEHIVSKHEINIQQRAMKLVEMANEAGGKDNITVQLVEFAVSIKKEKAKNKESNKKPFLVIGLAVIVILAVLLIVSFFFFGKNKTDKGDSSEIVQMEPTTQVETISNETITIPYEKGSSASSETKIPEDEKIVSSKVTKGEQVIKIVRTDGRIIIIQWLDKDFSDTDLNEAKIEISLITDKSNEYIRRIKVLTSEQEPAGTGADASVGAAAAESSAPPAQELTSQLESSIKDTSPHEETSQDDTKPAEAETQTSDELETGETGSKEVE